MKKLKLLAIIAVVILLSTAIVSCGSAPADTEAEEAPKVELTEAAKDCIECHSDETLGIVMDWDESVHEV